MHLVHTELFLRGMPHLHSRMHRLTPNEKKLKLDPDDEPDLHKIAELNPLPPIPKKETPQLPKSSHNLLFQQDSSATIDSFLFQQSNLSRSSSTQQELDPSCIVRRPSTALRSANPPLNFRDTMPTSDSIMPDSLWSLSPAVHGGESSTIISNLHALGDPQPSGLMDNVPRIDVLPGMLEGESNAPVPIGEQQQEQQQDELSPLGLTQEQQLQFQNLQSLMPLQSLSSSPEQDSTPQQPIRQISSASCPSGSEHLRSSGIIQRVKDADDESDRASLLAQLYQRGKQTKKW